MPTETYYAIRRRDGSYVSRGGRTARKMTQAWLWSDEQVPTALVKSENAEGTILFDWQNGETKESLTVVPITITS